MAQGIVPAFVSAQSLLKEQVRTAPLGKIHAPTCRENGQGRKAVGCLSPCRLCGQHRPKYSRDKGGRAIHCRPTLGGSFLLPVITHPTVLGGCFGFPTRLLSWQELFLFLILHFKNYIYIFNVCIHHGTDVEVSRQHSGASSPLPPR